MAIWNFWKQEHINLVRLGCLDGSSLENAIRIRCIDTNLDTQELIENKTKFPFKTDKDVSVYIVTNLRNISFIIPAGYIWNGADIPSFLWSLVGASKDNSFLLASMVHDYMLQYKELTGFEGVDNIRLTSIIFREILKETGVPTVKANIMASSVHGYQFFCNKNSFMLK